METDEQVAFSLAAEGVRGSHLPGASDVYGQSASPSVGIDVASLGMLLIDGGDRGSGPEMMRSPGQPTTGCKKAPSC